MKKKKGKIDPAAEVSTEQQAITFLKLLADLRNPATVSFEYEDYDENDNGIESSKRPEDICCPHIDVSGCSVQQAENICHLINEAKKIVADAVLREGKAKLSELFASLV